MKTLEQIFTVINSLFEHLFEFLSGLISGMPEKKKGYNADFSAESSLLSSWNKGFCLTGIKNLSVKHSFKNALIISSTGGGKSSSVIIPSLFSTKGSFIINDPSGELFSKTAGYLSQQGFDIKVLNFTKPEISSGFNPIFRANKSSEINKVSTMLIQGSLGGNKADPFWNNSAISLLSMLISILKTQSQEYQTLYNTRHLLNSLAANPKGVDMLFSDHADPTLFAEYKALIAGEDKILNSVIATCKASLSLFADESVAKVTSYDNIDFSDFRKRPTALFINNSTADMKYFSNLTSLLFEQFFSFVFSKFPSEEEQNLYLILDEASSLHIPTLPIGVANIRKFRCGAMISLQSENQLVHQYGKHEADGIKANCFAKMYFTGQSLETATELEKILGKYQYEDEQKRKVVRSLMTSDEIRTMKETQALLICGHHSPVIVRLKPYYKQTQYSKYALIPPPVISSLAPVGSISVLPLNLTTHEQEQ